MTGQFHGIFNETFSVPLQFNAVYKIRVPSITTPTRFQTVARDWLKSYHSYLEDGNSKFSTALDEQDETWYLYVVRKHKTPPQGEHKGELSVTLTFPDKEAKDEFVKWYRLYCEWDDIAELEA